MRTVNSSHVWQVGYDEAASELHVRYYPTVKNPGGRLVIYENVEPETAERVTGDDVLSTGSALHSYIKQKGYSFR
jgi:hypothetical protein